MPTKKLTGTTLERLKPAEGEARTNYFDTAHTGLALRVGKRDRTWTFHYRFNGRPYSKVLGKFAKGKGHHMDREAAIKAAVQVEELVQAGIDPRDPRDPAAPVPEKAPTNNQVNPNTFEARVQQYLRLYRKNVKPSTYDQAARLLTSEYVKPLAQMDLRKVSRGQITGLLEGMDDTPTQANRLQAYLAKFFTWCWDKEYVEPSPMVGLTKRFKEKPRKRNLTPAELVKVWKGCEKLGYPLGTWVQMVLVTGQRPGECRKMRHGDVHEGIWLVEGGDPKNDERHRVPLPKLAREVLGKCPRFEEGDYVFTTTFGKRPVGQGGKPYAALYEAAGLEKAWRPHDLRRSFVTRCSEDLDVGQALLGAICNQRSVSKPGVSSTYNQASWMTQKGKVLESWNRYLAKLLEKAGDE